MKRNALLALMLFFLMFAMNNVKPSRGSYNTPEITEDPGHLYYWTQYFSTASEVTAGGSSISCVHGTGPTVGSQCLVWNTGAGLPPGVGGVQIPVDKFGLFAPYIGLASAILAATVGTPIYVKRVKHEKEKQ